MNKQLKEKRDAAWAALPHQYIGNQSFKTYFESGYNQGHAEIEKLKAKLAMAVEALEFVKPALKYGELEDVNEALKNINALHQH